MEGQKIFINMCGCSEVAAPGNWQNGVPPELEESFSSMESWAEDGMQNLRFSLSCSDHILSTDKLGNLCKVYDVVFNLVVMRHAKVQKQLRTFLINMAMTWISQKYNIALKPDFKIPKGKYKGDVVRKHYIRAAKAQLVSEITDEDAELQPSFPLLIDRACQPLKSQEVEPLQDEYTCDKSIDVPKSGPATEDNMTTKALNGPKSKTTVASHQGSSKQNLHVIKDPISHEASIALSASKRTCDLNTNVTSQGEEAQSTKKNDIGINEALCNLSSVALLEEKKIECKLKSCVPSQNITMQNAKFLAQRTPWIHVKYLGYPVELVVMCLLFPSCLKLQDFQVWASNTKVYVEASSYEPIMVPLVFPTTPKEAKATFFGAESRLEVYLPFLTYVEFLA